MMKINISYTGSRKEFCSGPVFLNPALSERECTMQEDKPIVHTSPKLQTREFYDSKNANFTAFAICIRHCSFLG